MDQPIRLIIVDDHQVVVDGLKILLMSEEDIEVVGFAYSGEQLFELLPTMTADVLILDLILPGMNGIEVATKLRESHPDLKIIIFSGNTPEDLMMDSIDAGALGVLPKNTPQEELVEAIHAVHRGETYFGDNITKALLHKFVKRDKDAKLDEESPVSNLTVREIEIIQHFAAGKSYKEIANSLHISTHTVESHKNNVLKKLELRTIIDLVKFGIKHGIVELD